MAMAEQTSKHAADCAAPESDVATGFDDLRRILSGPLPGLPRGRVAMVARDLRTVATPAARRVWCHPGWAAIIEWVSERKPGCDPVVPAIHAIRRADRATRSRGDAVSVATYVLRVADSYRQIRPRRREVPMRLDVAEREEPEPSRSRSLSVEASQLLGREGIRMSGPTWELVSDGIDIAVDWWLDVSRSSGLVGKKLVDTVTGDSSNLSSGRRLRQYFEGPFGRPLVALLLGGDQLGSAAQRSAGTRPSLVLAAMEARLATDSGQPVTRPAPPVIRAWRTAISRIDTLAGQSTGHGIAPEPFVAA